VSQIPREHVLVAVVFGCEFSHAAIALGSLGHGALLHTFFENLLSLRVNLHGPSPVILLVCSDKLYLLFLDVRVDAPNSPPDKLLQLIGDARVARSMEDQETGGTSERTTYLEKHKF